jgi:hypothetical protein
MKLHRRPKKLVIGAAVTALVALMAQASAHVTLGIPTLEVTDLYYRVPVEPAPTTPEELAARHTDKLVVDVPVGFKVELCHETADFACEVGAGEITWTRRADSTNFQPVDYFRASLRTPGIGGTYLSPALQVYSDGEEVA